MSDPKHSADQLLIKGEQLLAGGNEDLAVQFLLKGLEQEPRHVDLLRVLGETYMDMGRVDEAREMFKRGVDSIPNDPTFYMYLGQISGNQDALAAYERGVDLLEKQLQACEPKGAEHIETKLSARQLACAYCSLAELFMSDLCFEDDAEARCDKYLTRALQVYPGHPQALQCMASFRLSQNRPDDAKPLVLDALDRIQKALGYTDQGGDDDDMMMDATPLLDQAEEEDVETLIPFEFRAATARILMEVGECVRAIPLMERLINENDTIVEIWLLLAECHMAAAQASLADECLENAQDLCTRLIASEPSLAQDEQFVGVREKVNRFRTFVTQKLASEQNGGAASSSSSS